MKSIAPSAISGETPAPPSKSMTVRAIAAASLAYGTTTIANPSSCDDAAAALGIIKDLGADCYSENGNLVVIGENIDKNTSLDCRESGLCMRMFPFIASLYPEEFTFNASGSLLSRPVGMVEKALAQLGASCSTNSGFPPLKVRGPIKGGKVEAEGSESSQHITGMLMALPLCTGDSEILVNGLRSKPYVAMTLGLLEAFGISITKRGMEEFGIRGGQKYIPMKKPFPIEGDWSGAAFMLAAGATAGKVTVRGLRMDSLQADRAIMGALRSAGAKIRDSESGLYVEKSPLRAFEFDATECPDLFPPLAALAANCAGTTRIKGAGRLKGKESDRASALCAEFSRLGIKISVDGDVMEIAGGKINGGEVDSHNDHRIAMACAIAALNAGGEVKIRNPECVSKSYPGFFEALGGLMK